MCRYAMHGPYKNHYACFDCRRSVKWPLDAHAKMTRPREQKPAPVVCPECHLPMNYMGKDFKPPPKGDVKQWEKVRILAAHGFRYDSCGCCGPGLRPAELRDVEAFLADQLPKSRGEMLLRAIEERAGHT